MRCCIHRLLLLGADPNQRAPPELSPLIAVSMGPGRCKCDPLQQCQCRLLQMSELLACGARVETIVIKYWLHRSENTQERNRALELLMTYKDRRSLQTLAACVVRKCLATAQFDGVMKNADSLPLPSRLKALLKLENDEIVATGTSFNLDQ